MLAVDWPERASALAALGHPVRLRLLHEIVHGRTTVKALAELDDIGTSGQIYHHLRQLIAAGWLRATARGVVRRTDGSGRRAARDPRRDRDVTQGSTQPLTQEPTPPLTHGD